MNTSLNGDEYSKNTAEWENLFNDLESIERCSRPRCRSRSPTKQSSSSRERAAGRLEDTRKEIHEAAKKRQEDRKSGEQETGQRYVRTEGRFQPDGWGFVERGPRGYRPVPEDSNTTDGQESVSRHNEDTSAELLTKAASLLRESQRFGPHMVPMGKQTPLREVATKHQSANEIRRPQSKILILDATLKDTGEEQKEWDYSDMEDDEIF